MKHRKLFLILITFLSLSITAYNQTPKDPWTADQLMEPEKLAAILNDPSATQPLILNIGPVNMIKGAIKIGPAKEKENMDELQKLLSKEDRKRAIVFYCGCCPFKDCPNVRPAFSLLTKMKFENFRLLNLSHNLKTDWINHGYPMSN